MKTEPKFKETDLVGWKSDSDFIARNKNLPAVVKVVDVFYYKKTNNYQYRLENVIGFHWEHELESREPELTAE